MTLKLDVEAIPKGIRQSSEGPADLICAAGRSAPVQKSVAAAGETDQSLSMLKNSVKRNFAARSIRREKGPRRQQHQVAVADLILGKEGDLSPFSGDAAFYHIKRETGDRLRTYLAKRVSQLKSAKQVIIGYAQGWRHCEVRPLRKILRSDHALKKR